MLLATYHTSDAVQQGATGILAMSSEKERCTNRRVLFISESRFQTVRVEAHWKYRYE